MSENLRSALVGIFPLYIVACIALILTIFHKGNKPNQQACNRIVYPFLLGVACQCLHFIEEYIAEIYIILPPQFGLTPMPEKFFVTFNLIWIAVWVVTPVGIYKHFQVAYFPAWFFTLAMIANGILHPLLAITNGSYIPGLITSPLVGIIGIILIIRLRELINSNSTN